MPAAIPIALSIAGSDSSGGAGIQADLRTFSAFGVYGATVLTALTAQNTLGVTAIETVAPSFVVAQIDAVLGDLDVGAVKTGMLATAEIAAAVADRLAAARLPLVVDPVMVATSGDVLLKPDAIEVIRRRLLPLATVATPNLPEAARLLEGAVASSEAEMVAQARALLALGPQAVLIKGGHGTGDEAIDVLVTPQTVARLAHPRIATRNTHGTGCTLSAALAALLAQGVPLDEASVRAKTYVWRALEGGRDIGVGRGRGPVDHLFAIRQGARIV